MTARQSSRAHLTLLDVPVPELVRIAAAATHDHVGLRTIPLHLPGEPLYELHAHSVLNCASRLLPATTGSPGY